jgi:lysophospholipase L1-like esterase
MKLLACFWAAASLALAQNGALLSNQDALKLEQRTVQLIESTGLAVPGLARAGAPALEEARQTFANLQTAPQNAGNSYTFLATARAYLSISDTVPKPYPFSDEARRQFGELRDSVDRLESHFRALLDLKETQLRNPDRDNLKRYAEANAKLAAPSPQRPRVVFLGDSITDGWRLNEYYGSERDFVNRGISGQITGEMLGREKADVIDLKPQAMLVLAGTNDLARGVPVTTIENNLSMIAELAEAHHIAPIFASVLPVSDYHKDANPQYAQSLRRPPAQILELNNWLKSYCERRHFAYVDYYSAVVDKDGFLQADASDDGLHPNAKGYRLMAPIALAAVDSTTRAEVRPAGRKFRAAKVPPTQEKAPQVTKAEAPKPRETNAEAEKAAAQKVEAQKAAAQRAEEKKSEQQKAREKKAEARQAADEKKAEAQKAAEEKKAADQKKAEDKAAEAKKEKEKKKSGLRAWLEKDHK